MSNTWQCHSYLSCKNYAKMKMLHTKYGALEKLEVNLQDVISSRFIGISKPHALYMCVVLTTEFHSITNYLKKMQRMNNHQRLLLLISTRYL
ncbi:MAG: hypothetical protein WBF33_03385 [Candidatus Nitrosopolaris sp.]